MDRITLIIVIVLLLFGISSSQIVNETFSNFNNTGLWSSAVGVYVFDPTTGFTITEDQANSHDLSINGWANYAALVAACSGTNPNLVNGTALHNDETASNYLYTATEDDFRPGTSDFTYQFWYKDDDVTSDNDHIFDLGGLSTVIWGVRCIIVNLGVNVSLYNNTTGYLLTAARQVKDDVTGLGPVGVWHHVVVTNDRDGNSIGYVDGIPQTGQIVDMSASVGVDVSPSRDLRIGTSYNASTGFGGYLLECSFYKSVLTPKQIREDFALAKNWFSKLGYVTRDTSATTGFDFQQGFYNSDTLYFSVADTTNNAGFQWNASFTARGTKAGDSIFVKLGTGEYVGTALTASDASYSIDLGQVTTSSEYFYMVASASDTVYIDNLVVNEALIPVSSGTIKYKYDTHDKFDGWIKQ